MSGLIMTMWGSPAPKTSDNLNLLYVFVSPMHPHDNAILCNAITQAEADDMMTYDDNLPTLSTPVNKSPNWGYPNLVGNKSYTVTHTQRYTYL